MPLALVIPPKSSHNSALTRAGEATVAILGDNLRTITYLPPWMGERLGTVDFLTDEQWKELPDAAYSIVAMLMWHGSKPREDVATLTLALSVMREVLKRRPAEFGGPMEVR